MNAGRLSIRVATLLGMLIAASPVPAEPPEPPMPSGLFQPDESLHDAMFVIVANPRRALADCLRVPWEIERETFTDSGGCALLLRDGSRQGPEHAIVYILPSGSTEKLGQIQWQGKSFQPILKAANGYVYLWADAGKWTRIQADITRALLGRPLDVQPFTAAFQPLDVHPFTAVFHLPDGTRHLARLRPNNWLQLYRFGMKQEDLEDACEKALEGKSPDNLAGALIDTGSHPDVPLATMADILATAPDQQSLRLRLLDRAVRQRIDSLSLVIRFGHGLGDCRAEDPPMRCLTLEVRPNRHDVEPLWPKLAISRQTAEKLLDQLVRQEFFTEAVGWYDDYDQPPRGRCYWLRLAVYDTQRSYVLEHSLGLDLATIEWLRGLAGVLDGEEAKAIAVLLERLEPYAEAWRKAAADPEFVKAEAEALQRDVAQYIEDVHARKKPAHYLAGNPLRKQLLPLLIPHLLVSSNPDLRHEGLLLVRSHPGNPELIPPVLELLERMLADPIHQQSLTRRLVYEILAQQRDLRSVPVLIKALGDPGQDHYMWAGPDGHAEQSQRINWTEAHHALQEITWADPIDRNGEQKISQTAWRRWWQENGPRLTASETPPWRQGNRTEFQWRMAQLDTSLPEVQIRGAKGLGRLGDPRAVGPLLEALGDSEYGVGSAVREALVRFGPLAVGPAIHELQQRDSRVLVAEVLGQSDDPRVLKPLLYALRRDDNEEVRSRAALGLGHLGDRAAVEPLIAALDDSAPGVSSSAAQALGKLGDPAAVEPLIERLADEYAVNRLYAAEALGKLGDPRAVEPLRASLDDENEHVRIAAETALGQIKSRNGNQEEPRPGVAPPGSDTVEP